MVWALVLGALAGFAVPYLEPSVKRAVEQLAQARIAVAQGEMDVLTLVLLLLAAAVLTGGDDAIALMVGALAGVFGKRIVAAIQGRRDGA